MSPLDMLRCGAWPSLQVRIRLARRWFSARGVNPMRRREFIRLFSSTVVAWPLTARAQQAAMPVIGFLNSSSSKGFPFVAAFRQGLSESGYVEGQNLAIEYRWADGDYEKLPRLAAELVDRHVSAIIAGGPPAIMAAEAATTTIPIVFTSGGNPIELGFVSSLSKPGGNVTGVSFLLNELGAKRLELLRELVPAATSVGFLAIRGNEYAAGRAGFGRETRGLERKYR